MVKSAKEKLTVDGTNKLAAKSKPSDKHEIPTLDIEEATVASPRPSRKRAGDYFDFDDDNAASDGADAGASSRPVETKTAKPKKKAKTAAATAADKDAKVSKATGAEKSTSIVADVKAETAKKAKGKKVDSVQADIVVGPAGDTAEVPGTEANSKKSKAANKTSAQKDKPKVGAEASGLAAGKANTESAKKSKGKKAEVVKDNTVLGLSGDTAGMPEKEVKAKKVKAAKGDFTTKEKPESKKTSKKEKKKAATDDIVVGPSGDTAAVPEKETTPKKAKKAKVAKDDSTTKEKSEGKKGSKKADTETAAMDKPESSKKSTKVTKEPAAKVVPESIKAATKPMKDAESSKKASKGKDVAEEAAGEPKLKQKKSKVASKKDAPHDETPAVAPDLAMDEGPFQSLLESRTGNSFEDTKAGEAAGAKKPKAKKDTKKPVNAEKPDAARPSTSADIAKVPEALGVSVVEKLTKAVKPKTESKAKKDTPAKEKDVAKPTNALAEPTKPAASGSKKRKTPASGDVEAVKHGIVDPVAEDASAKKKQKQSRKSLGDTMGELFTSGLDAASHGASAVRESLGGLVLGKTAPKTIVESASEIASGAVTEAKSATKKSKGKGKSTNKDVVESSAAPLDDTSDSEPDDQTVALLKGFESSGDEADPPSTAGFKEGQSIPKLPNPKQTAKKLKSIKATTTDTPGVVYVGRIPHGFFEHEMRAYFSQFGDISRLRLSRNKKTGRSKHFAFVEFKSEDVAKIVADTMDTYLMFGHILKCKVVNKDQLHENVWKGADKRFKAVPWNKIEGRKYELPVGREQWKGRVEEEKKRRSEKNEKLKEIGYEFEGTGLKDVDEVPKKVVAPTTDSAEQEKSLVTAAANEGGDSIVVSEEIKTKKTKKGGKVESKESVKVTKTAKRALETGEEVAGVATKKAKKVKAVAG